MRKWGRELREEVLGLAAVVLDVDSEEGDLVEVRLRGLGEETELGTAGRTPGAPLVDDDRVSVDLTAARGSASLAHLDAAPEGARDPRHGTRGSPWVRENQARPAMNSAAATKKLSRRPRMW
jgi:hypothetical protein